MGRWQPLPGQLDPQQRRLVERLRLMKDRAGLSLVSLAAKTAYSKSSWQRYLSGDKPAPWPAVDALGRLAGEDRARLRALWELTVQSRSTAGECEPAAPESAPIPQAPPIAVPGPRVTAVSVTVASLTAALLFLIPGSGPGVADRPEWPWALPSPAAATGGPACHGVACAGRDPRREGCVHDVRELGTDYASVHQVRLLYSPRCHAVWGEVSPPGADAGVSVSAPGKGLRQARAGGSHTLMIAVSDPSSAMACVVLKDKENCVNSRGQSWSE